MAKNKGSLELSGKMGDLVFYNSPYGPLVRRKGSLNKKRVMKEAAFERSRKAGTEFGRASSGGALLRGEVKWHFPHVVEHSTNYRLNRVLAEAIREEKVHGPGDRVLADADLGNLKGFEWNSKQPFSNVFKGAVKMEIDRARGVMRVHVPAVNFAKQLDALKGATHVVVTALGMAPDFDKGKCETAVAAGEMWKLTDSKAAAQVLEVVMKPGHTGHLILGVGIKAFQEVNGKMYGLRHGDAFVVGMVDSTNE